MSDQPEALTPIKPERLAREIREICAEHNSGQITELQYEQRFARMIGEVRDRRPATAPTSSRCWAHSGTTGPSRRRSGTG
jgi:hypothetical protein